MVLQDQRIYEYIDEAQYEIVDALSARYRRLVAGPGRQGEFWFNWILFLKDSLSPIGFIQATLNTEARSVEIAYVIASAFWRKSYGTEALEWLLREMAANSEIETAEAAIDVRNLASIALVQKLGFQRTRIVSQERCIDAIFSKNLVKRMLD